MIAHTKNGAEIIDHKKEIPKTLHFTPLLLRGRFGVPDNFPHDAFCPSRQKNLQESMCPCCKKSFVTKTAMLRHKRSLHLRQQGTESAYEESIRLEKIALRNRVTQVIDKSPRNSYLCVLQDGTCEWISFLQCDDALVKQYEEEVDNIVVPQTKK